MPVEDSDKFFSFSISKGFFANPGASNEKKTAIISKKWKNNHG